MPFSRALSTIGLERPDMLRLLHHINRHTYFPVEPVDLLWFYVQKQNVSNKRDGNGFLCTFNKSHNRGLTNLTTICMMRPHSEKIAPSFPLKVEESIPSTSLPRQDVMELREFKTSFAFYELLYQRKMSKFHKTTVFVPVVSLNHS